MRYSLLITAVATVTVPGVLAMVGVVGHDRVAAGSGAAATAAFEGTLTGPFPVAPEGARAPLRDNLAALQRAGGAPVTVFGRVTVGQQVMGMRLLAKAADADLVTSYEGTEVLSQSGVGGRVMMVSQVWHTGGGPTLVQTSDGTSSSPASAVAVTSSPVAVFGLTKSLVTLLGRHYVAVYQGAGAANGRAATVVELYRFDGSLAARYWLDRQTVVPLRRVLLDTSEKVISEDSFTRIQFGALAVPRSAGSPEQQSVQQSVQAAQPAWSAEASPARFVASLSGLGWPLPTTLPGGLPLYAAASTSIEGGKVADLEYTDGLYVVSLFAQRGTLAPDIPGWRPVRMAGKQAYVSGHSVTWAAAGLVYTMIANAPPQTVTEVIGTLTPSDSPGLLGRLLHGFDRLARQLNPFG
jgi:sigma-E factor negative regulatory protein RseB